MHEAVFAGSVFSVLTCLRFFVDDKGQTFCERGLDQVQGPRKKRFLRVTAVLGVVISIFLIYHLPMGFLALHSRQWPDDVVQRSYFTNGICRPEVNIACPGPGIPISRPGAPRMQISGGFTSSVAPMAFADRVQRR